MPERTRLTPVAEVDAVVALRPLHRPVMDCKGRRIALPKRHDVGAALHARPLFGQDELAACEIHAGLREENRDLDGECEIAVEVLVETVEIARDVLQQKRRARLAGVAASIEERRVVARIALVDSHPAVPFVGNACEAWIERRSQATEEVGKRVFEVAILALAEAVARHVDVASEAALVGIEGRDGAAFRGREELRQDGAAVAVELAWGACQS
jgi:hypothetical protein